MLPLPSTTSKKGGRLLLKHQRSQATTSWIILRDIRHQAGTKTEIQKHSRASIIVVSSGPHPTIGLALLRIANDLGTSLRPKPQRGIIKEI
jgi:hypothetical protein